MNTQDLKSKIEETIFNLERNNDRFPVHTTNNVVSMLGWILRELEKEAE